MNHHIVGFGFRPTDEELINHYLNNKILGQTWLVENAINEVSIYSFDPWDLRFQSRIDSSNDYVWYFFCRLENKKMQSRKTSSGYWKKTGPDLDVKPRRGNRGNKIGVKKVLVFHRGRTPNGLGTEWVMHEYHTTFFHPDQIVHGEPNYVICKVEFKGDDSDMSSVSGIGASHSLISHVGDIGALSTGSEVNQQDRASSGVLQNPNQFNANLNGQQQDFNLDLDGVQRFLDNLTEEDKAYMFGDQEVASHCAMQQNFNAYKPKRPLTGRYDDDDDSSESDAESSSATIHKNITWSSVVETVSSSKGYRQDQKNNITKSITEYDAESRGFSKNINEEEQWHPRGWKMQVPQREKCRERRVAEESKKENHGVEKMEEWEMTEETDKKASMGKKGWFVFEKVMDRSGKTQLINIIVGFVVFVALIREIMSVR